MGKQEMAKAEAPASRLRQMWSASATYISFVLVGNGCGWFVAGALWQTLANEPEVAQGGKMFGTLTALIGYAGLATAFLYATFLVAASDGISVRMGRRISSLQIAGSVATFVMLMFFWDVGPPRYPIFILAAVLSSVIANTTYFVLFPQITAYYDGRYVAPVRAGTDISTMITGLLGEAQNPTGNRDLFPPWILFLAYALLSGLGLVAWLCILRRGLGLKSGSAPGNELGQQAEDDQEAAQVQGKAASKRGLSEHLRALACPWPLLPPILLAVLAEITQWAVVNSVAMIGARMIDPAGCDGAAGRGIYRTALTLSNILVPLCSFASSLGSCPKWAFYLLGAVQLSATTAVCLATFGIGRDAWQTSVGHVAYISSVGTVAGLEGYLLTMAYRYIGEADSLSAQVRLSASTLLSFLSIVGVNPMSIIMGNLVNSGHIECTALH